MLCVLLLLLSQVTTRARAGRGASVLLVFYTSFGSDLNRWIKHPINDAQALSLWAILMFLLGSKSSPCGRIAQQFKQHTDPLTSSELEIEFVVVPASRSG